ncbi:hypothetical protein GCM10025773_32610 [Microbacterium jejuense]
MITTPVASDESAVDASVCVDPPVLDEPPYRDPCDPYEPYGELPVPGEEGRDAATVVAAALPVLAAAARGAARASDPAITRPAHASAVRRRYHGAADAEGVRSALGSGVRCVNMMPSLSQDSIAAPDAVSGRSGAYAPVMDRCAAGPLASGS